MLGRVVRNILTKNHNVEKLLQVPHLQNVSQKWSSDWVKVYGGNGSPYTRKVQSALRYKRIPFTQHMLMPGDIMGDWEELGFGEIKPKVIPVIKYSDGTVQNDSTFIFENVEKLYPTRSIVPQNPLDGFLALLLEDMFDEWGTKVMFGMRWLKERDQNWSGTWLIYDFQLGTGMPLKKCAEAGRMFGSRQVSRMKIVGCDNPEVISRSFDTFVGSLERHLAKGSLCILGSTPTIADFALYGQLSQLVVDRTPDEIIRDNFPAVWSWVRKFEDLSGLKQAHCDNKTYLKEILTFAGEVYLPFLAANSAALAAGEKELKVNLWKENSIEHIQPVFKYQDKCFQRIKQSYANLSLLDKKRVNELMSDTNCVEFLQN